ncbi:MAG TPA: TolC family outer membrane protein [Xanthobacteraceae bacterium]|nr:TolC family outer membrane protein [Xanthobacteraceae bacterium]
MSGAFEIEMLMLARRGWPISVAPRARTALLTCLALTGATVHFAAADTLEGALSLAFQNNPQLNAQRAATRAADENVPVALSGYRPQVSGSAVLGEQYLDTLSKDSGGFGYSKSSGAIAIATYGLTTKQTLFNGFQTASRTRLAECQVLAARETLRGTEQTILLNAATAYMNMLRDAALLELQRNNVKVLEALLRQTRDRFDAGELTRTDLAQAESSLAAGRSSLHAAESNYITSRSAYVQVIGVEPGRLANASPVDRFFPRSLRAALELAAGQNPAITTAMYNVDAAVEQVKVQESALYPNLSLNGSLQKSYGSQSQLSNLESLSGSVVGQLTIPISQGGAEYANIRQAKETLGQRRLDLDTARLSVQQNVIQSWGQLEAAKAQIDANIAQVTSAEIALDGVREEARVGQRTTLDVLNAQQALVQARTALVTAQHDRVVASYTVLAAVGSLSPRILGLRVQSYDPAVHYQQVRDQWFGARTPDGR